VSTSVSDLKTDFVREENLLDLSNAKCHYVFSGSLISTDDFRVAWVLSFVVAAVVVVVVVVAIVLIVGMVGIISIAVVLSLQVTILQPTDTIQERPSLKSHFVAKTGKH
jgi:asparagine N-glycosylation enzyme membrane subunit Stt3